MVMRKYKIIIGVISYSLYKLLFTCVKRLHMAKLKRIYIFSINISILRKCSFKFLKGVFTHTQYQVTGNSIFL